MEATGLSAVAAGAAGGAAAAPALRPLDAMIIPIDVDAAMDLPAVSLRDVLTVKGTWTWLPELTDFSQRIAEYLDPDDLGRLMRVSRAWRDAGTAMATNMHKVWYKHIRSMPELPDPSTMRCIERLDLTGYDRVELLTPGRVTPGRVTPGRATPTRSSARRSTSSSFGSPASFGSVSSTPVHAAGAAAALAPLGDAPAPPADAPLLHGVGFAVPSVRRATPTNTAVAAGAGGPLLPATATTRRQRAAELSAAISSMTGGGGDSGSSATDADAAGRRLELPGGAAAMQGGGGGCGGIPVGVPPLATVAGETESAAVAAALAAPSPITPALPVAIAVAAADGLPIISAPPPSARPPRPGAAASRAASGSVTSSSIVATAAPPVDGIAAVELSAVVAHAAPVAAVALSRSRSAGPGLGDMPTAAAASPATSDGSATTPPAAADACATKPPPGALVRSHSAGAATGGSGGDLLPPAVSMGCTSPPRSVSAGGGGVSALGLGGDTERSTWLDRFLLDTTACERLKAVKLGANMPVPLMARLLANCVNLEAVSFAGIESIKDEFLAKVVLPRLRTVDLTDNRRITASGMAAFVGQCPRIQRLVMTRCRFGGTDDSLMAIASGLRSLEFLVADLNGRPLSPHQLLDFLCAAPPSLAKVKFENVNLTADGWIELLTRLRHRGRSQAAHLIIAGGGAGTASTLPARGAASTPPFPVAAPPPAAAAAAAAAATLSPLPLPCRTNVDLVEFHCAVGFDFDPERVAAIMAAAPSYASLPAPVVAGDVAAEAGAAGPAAAAPAESTVAPPRILLTRLVSRSTGESRVEVQCPRLAAWLQLRR